MTRALFVSLCFLGGGILFAHEQSGCDGEGRRCPSGQDLRCINSRWTCVLYLDRSQASGCPSGFLNSGSSGGSWICVPLCQGVPPCDGATCIGGNWICPKGSCSGWPDCENAVCDGTSWRCPWRDCYGQPPSCGLNQMVVCGHGSWGCQENDSQGDSPPPSPPPSGGQSQSGGDEVDLGASPKAPESSEATIGGVADRSAKTEGQALAALSGAERAMSRRDFAGAEKLASDSVALYPGNPAALRIRSQTRNFLGRYREAEQDARQAIALSPSAAAYENLAWAQYRQGKLPEALDSADRAVTLNPHSALAYAIRAAVQQALGKRWAALRDIRRAAELDRSFERRRDAAERGGLIFEPKDADASFFARGEAPATPAADVRPFPWKGGLAAFLAVLLIALPSVILNRRRRSGSWKVALTPLPPVKLVETADDALIGGKYRLGKMIGRGGMGVVFEAMDEALGRKVAVKRMSEEAAGMGEAQRRKFSEEAKTLASLHHPGIVDIYDIVEQAGAIYLVFEFALGRTAYEILTAEGRLPLKRIEEILRPVCQALEYAHRKQFVHRDIKPENIMVLDEGGAKLMDFGIARRLSSGDDKKGPVRTRTVVGTPGYIAPECWTGVVRKESDLYALGVTLYELLTGALPPSGPRDATDQVPQTFWPISGIPAGVNQLLARALERDPDRRIASAEEFLSLLELASRPAR